MTSARTTAIAFALALCAMAPLTACSPSTIDTGAIPPTPAAPLQWPSPPTMQIDPSKSYQAVFNTEVGEFTVQLFADEAPLTVNNFIFLASHGYYENSTFHRVLPGFMAQGGDPTGTGAGGPGYTFQDEFAPNLQFDRAGLLAMANRGPDTNAGQFFITYAPTPHLNRLHTIFGEIVEGAAVLDALTPRDPLSNPDYQGTKLLSIGIIEADA